MTDPKAVFSHSPDIVTRKTGNEYVLVPVTNNIADMESIYTLNETGAVIWELIDGEKNVEEIILTLTGEYDIAHKSASEDVISFLNEMSKYLIIKI
jgi:hypothetical protein